MNQVIRRVGPLLSPSSLRRSSGLGSAGPRKTKGNGEWSAELHLTVGPTRLMMKADWQTPGKATGRIRCTVTLPAIDERWKFAELSIKRIHSLLRRHLPTALSALEDATLVVSAEMRAPSHGVRWRPIARWRAPDALAPVLERAGRLFESLPKEPSWRKRSENG
jgi:hypothetical protein